MARVSQFAKDLGINYNQAKDLINKGRNRKDGGSQILEKTMSNTKKDPMAERFGKDGEFKVRPKSQKPYHPKHNPNQYHPTLNPDGKKGRPKMQKKKDGGLGMQSVKYGIDNNPKITAADPKAKFIAANKKDKPMKAKDGASVNKEFPEPKETTAEFRIEMIPKEYRESFRKKFMSGRGETSRKVEKKAGGGMPKFRDGGVFRGCGAQVKGKKFKGVF